MAESKKSASSQYKIGDYIEIIVCNSHYKEIGKVVGFDPYNEFNLKIEFDNGFVQGYMVDEVKHIPRLGQEKKFSKKLLRKLFG